MIVIGGSLGGMRAVRALLAALPPGLEVPIAVVLHRQKESDESLVEVLAQYSALPVHEVLDKDPIIPGRVVVAPPDYHLLVDGDCFSLSIDPSVNFARPSIDVLFESAADCYGPGLVGVVLSGANQDGALGVAAIEKAGGKVVIEDPTTTECSVMPASAIRAARAPHILPLRDIPARLLDLSTSIERKQ